MPGGGDGGSSFYMRIYMDTGGVKTQCLYMLILYMVLIFLFKKTWVEKERQYKVQTGPQPIKIRQQFG